MFTVKSTNMMVWPMIGVAACAAMLTISSLSAEVGELSLDGDGGPIRVSAMPRASSSSHAHRASVGGSQTQRFDASGTPNRRIVTPKSSYTVEADGETTDQVRRSRANASTM